jgi:hypothetical protein
MRWLLINQMLIAARRDNQIRARSIKPITSSGDSFVYARQVSRMLPQWPPEIILLRANQMGRTRAL